MCSSQTATRFLRHYTEAIALRRNSGLGLLFSVYIHVIISNVFLQNSGANALQSTQITHAVLQQSQLQT